MNTHAGNEQAGGDGGRQRAVSASRVVAAPPEKIFEILTDPQQHAVIDGSGMVQRARGGATRLELGSRFGMDMKLGLLPYRIDNTVVEFEPGRRIAWRHFGGHRWRYELEPVAEGTRVTETFDWSTSKFPPAIERMRYPARNKAAMEKTLDRLAAHLEGSASG